MSSQRIAGHAALSAALTTEAVEAQSDRGDLADQHDRTWATLGPDPRRRSLRRGHRRPHRRPHGHIVGHGIGSPPPPSFDGRPHGHIVGRGAGAPAPISPRTYAGG